MQTRPLTVFCDFDGTITQKDMIVAVCEKFCPPGWETVKEAILTRKLSVKEGVAQLFRMIPSDKREEIITYAKEILQIRDGFEEFLKFCRDNGLRFIVCSGGIDFFVLPLLEPYRPFIEKTFTIHADFAGPTITLQHTHACETCGACKARILKEYPDSIRILIGDSVTDVHGASVAELVYARNGLCGYLDQDGIAYQPFETFHDILKHLKTFNPGACHVQP